MRSGLRPQAGVGRHDRRRHHGARVDQVPHLPFVGVLAADAREIGAGALGAPQHRVVVLGFDGQRIRAVALDLVAQGADHLRVTGVAALADVDVAAGQLERRVDPHVGRVLDRLMDGEQRRDLDRAADAGDQDDGDRKSDRLALEPVVKAEHGGYSAACGTDCRTGHGRLGIVDRGFRHRLWRRGRGPSSRRCSSRSTRRSGTAGRRSRARRSTDASRSAS